MSTQQSTRTFDVKITGPNGPNSIRVEAQDAGYALEEVAEEWNASDQPAWRSYLIGDRSGYVQLANGYMLQAKEILDDEDGR